MSSAAEERPRRLAGRGRTPSRWPSACFLFYLLLLVVFAGRGFAVRCGQVCLLLLVPRPTPFSPPLSWLWLAGWLPSCSVFFYVSRFCSRKPAPLTSHTCTLVVRFCLSSLVVLLSCRLGSWPALRWRESCPWWPLWRLTSSCGLTCSTTASRSRRRRHKHAPLVRMPRRPSSLVSISAAVQQVLPSPEPPEYRRVGGVFQLGSGGGGTSRLSFYDVCL